MKLANEAGWKMWNTLPMFKYTNYNNISGFLASPAQNVWQKELLKSNKIWLTMLYLGPEIYG
jgi:hypothetical protein